MQPEHADLMMQAADQLNRSADLTGRLAARLDTRSTQVEQLTKGIRRIASKHGVDHPQIAEELNRLLAEVTA